MITPITPCNENKSANTPSKETNDEFSYPMQNTPLNGFLGLEFTSNNLDTPDNTIFNLNNNIADLNLPQRNLNTNQQLTMDDIAYLQFLTQHQNPGLETDRNLGESSDTSSFTPSPTLGLEALENEMMLFSTPNLDVANLPNDMMRCLNPQQMNPFCKDNMINQPLPIKFNNQFFETQKLNDINAVNHEQKVVNGMMSPMEYEALLSRTNEWRSMNLHHGHIHNQRNPILDNMVVNPYTGLLSPQPSNLHDPNMMMPNLSFPYFPAMSYYQPNLPYNMYSGYEEGYITNNPHHNSFDTIKVKRHKNVGKACTHCKKAHLACDESRPCKRCTHLGKQNCVDVEHKRRGRPKSSTLNQSNNSNKKVCTAEKVEGEKLSTISEAKLETTEQAGC